MSSNDVILESNRSATPECSRTGMWERFVEWWKNPCGRCSRHGCPIRERWYAFSGYDGMSLEFCPQCEDEEATAKWMPIKSRKLSDDSPMTPSRVTA